MRQVSEPVPKFEVPVTLVRLMPFVPPVADTDVKVALSATPLAMIAPPEPRTYRVVTRARSDANRAAAARIKSGAAGRGNRQPAITKVDRCAGIGVEA